MSEAGPRPRRGPKPAIRYDFSKGYIAQNLPPEAVVAMRARGIGTNQMEQELRSYLKFRGIETARAFRVVQIVSRHVDIYPVSVVEMERVLGTDATREVLGDRVPLLSWSVQDFLDHIDVRLGYAHRTEVNRMIESMIARSADFEEVSRRHLRPTGYQPLDALRYALRRRAARKVAPRKAVART